MSLEYVLPLVQKYRNKGLLIDTNLLLLLVIGAAVPETLATFKPLKNQGFSQTDYSILARFASRFTKLITTPHVLTEVSNHCDKLKGDHRLQFCDGIVPFIKRLKEETVEAAILCQRERFVDFGLTDMAIAEISPDSFLVATVDFELCGYLNEKNVDAVNFNHLRLVANA